jgi:protein-tyrosine phosphatase
MAGYVDLHSHWIPEIDDGVTSVDEGLSLLRALAGLGFEKIIATPHMRPGMFDNTKEDLQRAYDRMLPHVESEALNVEVGLCCEHFFDDVVFDRIMKGDGVPYPGNHAVLVEFAEDHLPAMLTERLFDLRRKGLRPVIAHPERYRASWKTLSTMEDLVDRGTVLLMDVGALAGKYGRAPRKAAERMLDAGLYYAVCSDAHRPSDIVEVTEGIGRLRKLVGDEECAFLLSEGPQRVLSGDVDLG